MLAPEPVQAFADSTYAQRQEFRLESGAGLVLLDWFCCGRAACGERWTFTSLRSRNEIFLGGERILLDSLLLDSSHGRLAGSHGMGRFNCLALVIVIGDSLALPAAGLLADVAAQPVKPREPLLVSASPLADGVLLRLAATTHNAAQQALRDLLAPVLALAGGAPWLRRG